MISLMPDTRPIARGLKRFMTGRTRASRQSRRERRLKGERKKVSGLKSRRGHAVLSSVLTATGPQAAYGNAEGRLKRFSGGGPCRLSSPQHVRNSNAASNSSPDPRPSDQAVALFSLTGLLRSWARGRDLGAGCRGRRCTSRRGRRRTPVYAVAGAEVESESAEDEQQRRAESTSPSDLRLLIGRHDLDDAALLYGRASAVGTKALSGSRDPLPAGEPALSQWAGRPARDRCDARP